MFVVKFNDGGWLGWGGRVDSLQEARPLLSKGAATGRGVDYDHSEFQKTVPYGEYHTARVKKRIPRGPWSVVPAYLTETPQ